MRIVLFCATRRGLLVLKKLGELAPQAELAVFSFRETAWEPPFMDDIRNQTLAQKGQFHEARNVGGETRSAFWEGGNVDLMLAVNWRYLIPPAVYRKARLGAFVFHDSLLPVYRGFSPTVWSMINGETHTGATLFEISEAVDSGDIIGQTRVPIGPEDTIATVTESVTGAYLELLEEHLPALLQGTARRKPQDHSLATYTCRRLPEDNRINWSQSTVEIHNLIRATTLPYSGAHTRLDGQKLVVWGASRLPEPLNYVGRVPGRVVEVRRGSGTVVLTGDGALLLTEVQKADGERVCASDILNSLSQTLGEPPGE